MNFWQTLRWLSSQVRNTIYRLSRLAVNVSNSFAAVYSWVVSLTRGILNTAKSYALNLVNNTKTWFSGLLYSVKKSLTAFIENVRSFAQGLYDKSIAWINTKIAWLNGLLSARLDTLKGWVIGFISAQITRVRSWAEGTFSDIHKSLKELQDYLPLAKSLLVLLTAANLARLADLLKRIYGLLFVFASNPLVFFYGLLRGTFESFLCYVLAYGLGTEEAELPPWPTWGGAGGEIVYPEVIPGVYEPSGLISPLAHLWISGYTFGPTHHAVDLGAILGEPVYAMHEGVITEAGWSNVGYGFDVVVSGSEWWSRYAHLLSIQVMVGQPVAAGDVLGAANSTGNSTGNHLHLEIKRGGNWVDPVTVLPIGGG